MDERGENNGGNPAMPAGVGNEDFIEVQLEELDNRHCLQLEEEASDDDDYD